MILQVRSAAQIMAVSIGLALAYSSGELHQPVVIGRQKINTQLVLILQLLQYLYFHVTQTQIIRIVTRLGCRSVQKRDFMAGWLTRLNPIIYFILLLEFNIPI